MDNNFVLRPHGDKPYHTGVAVPIFSLRTETDFGIGQFSDLKILAKFANQSGMDIIQLLPVNDTTIFLNWKDSSPYRAVSVFALHPIYLDLSPFIGKLTGAEQKSFAAEKESLNALSQIDYEKTLALKWNYAAAIYKKIGKTTLDTADFKTFFEKNQGWLKAYAAFCVLRDKFVSADSSLWGKNFAQYSEKVWSVLTKDDKTAEKLNLQIFVQYLLHLQLKDAVEYCHSLGVAVKGDISVGVDRKSSDAWANPDIFNMDMQAGAPPDSFSVVGQNWEFPTYNWDKMAETGYEWWTHRMTSMAEYFDAYRLDHILGFFRIWEIPSTAVRGLLGHFSPALAMPDWEIENYGIPFRWWGIDRFVEPFIKDWVIDEIFGRDNRDYIITTFLDYTGNGNYRLKEFINTQRKVENLATQNVPDWQIDGLYRLHENVLFVRDHQNQYMYHPRIKMTETSSFRELGDEFKHHLERLYNDYFYGRNYGFWEEQAYKKLPAIKKATTMLACGEDLGMVPENVPNVMWNLQILRLIIERMPADGDFVSDLVYTPYLSVVTTSSHDTTPLRMWWEEDRAFTQRYYNHVMHWIGDAPQFAEPEIVQEIVRRNLNTKAMLAIIPIQDWLDMTREMRIENPADERINNPEHTYHYWRYRLPHHLEDLSANEGLTNFYRDFIMNTRRSSLTEE
ncbi:4-alpha-glucanotransferase [Lactococcus hircilactis]|uniref:4-alpha-glucanotransferase n=1 Tax=Lactococcus hircilactis TaxID=1494462 RepID=A0A7X2D0X2_9LACT|nr:4-alpha-glucanotransferase [Lactococcus hircilactis]MQW40404.1 4-alpha-glucanotransferase [Lactococcus hircilactis]